MAGVFSGRKKKKSKKEKEGDDDDAEEGRCGGGTPLFEVLFTMVNRWMNECAFFWGGGGGSFVCIFMGIRGMCRVGGACAGENKQGCIGSGIWMDTARCVYYGCIYMT